MVLREFHLSTVAAMLLVAALAITPAAGVESSQPVAGGPSDGGAAGKPDEAPRGEALQLIMVEEPGCRFCRRWDTEVGTAYAASLEGKIAPLQRVRREAPELAGLKPVIYTPTFILVRGRQELGRIPGYPGESFFWEELGLLLDNAGVRRDSEPSGARAARP